VPPVKPLAMLCPADDFFKKAKHVGFLPWHGDADSSGDEHACEASVPKRPKLDIVKNVVPEDSHSFVDEKNPYTPMPSQWHSSLSATLGFSVRVKPPSTTAGRILQHCKAGVWPRHFAKTSQSKQGSTTHFKNHDQH